MSQFKFDQLDKVYLSTNFGFKTSIANILSFTDVHLFEAEMFSCRYENYFDTNVLKQGKHILMTALLKNRKVL